MARYIAFAVVISLLASMTGIVLYRYVSMRRALESSARHFSVLVSVPLAQMAYMYGDEGMRGPLEARVSRLLQLNQDVESLEIVRDNGTRAFSASRDQIRVWSTSASPPSVDDLGLRQLIDQPAGEAGRVRVNGRTVYRVVVPGSEDRQSYGLSLVATFGYERVDRQLVRGAVILVIALLLGLVLTERVAAVLARGITRSLADLQTGVRKIRAGRLDEQVKISSGDEIEELADAFNEMTGELRQTIDRLRRANRELQALDQVKADLVANVSHELRTPLTALKGYLELLDDGELGELSKQAHRAVVVCRRNVDRLTLRVNDLVALSQMEKSLPDQHPSEPFDLIALVTTVAESYDIRVRSKGLAFSVDLPASLPLVDGNIEQIERVLINLLDNAVKFTAHGGAVSIAIEECDHDGRQGVLIRVIDTGIGIPQSEQVRVFDRFHQVDPSIRRRFGGMGLGLSLVHHIVESHNGVVWVESEPGSGSSFFVWLPSQRAGAAASPDGE